MEAVNSDLVTRLQEMQVETETMMQRVIKYRREAPLAAKRAFVARNDEFLAKLKQELMSPVEFSPEDLELCRFDKSITPNFYTNKLSSGLSNLVHLQNVSLLCLLFDNVLILFIFCFVFPVQTIPNIVAKLERAQAVITEEGGKRADENSQLLHRHRRLSRQFDLASKIGGF